MAVLATLRGLVRDEVAELEEIGDPADAAALEALEATSSLLVEATAKAAEAIGTVA